MNDTAEQRTSPERGDVLVGHCYTRARRHPLVIGRFPGGGQLWGGPYTIPQAIVIAGSFVVLLAFRQLWAHFGLLLNIVIALGLPYALGLLAKRFQVDGRNPLAVGASVASLVTAPAMGRMDGRPLKALTRRHAQGICTITWQDSDSLSTPSSGVWEKRQLLAASSKRGSAPSSRELEDALSGPATVESRPIAQPEAPVLSAASALLAARKSRTGTKED